MSFENEKSIRLNSRAIHFKEVRSAVMQATAKPTVPAKIWREVKRPFKKILHLKRLFRPQAVDIHGISIAENERANHYSCVEHLLDNNHGLSFFDKPSFPKVAQIQYKWDNLAFLFDRIEFQQFSPDSHADMYFSWGFGDAPESRLLARTAEKKRKPLYLVEDGFLKSADTWCHTNIDKKYVNGVSFTVDDKAMYFDTTRTSRLEEMLNDETLVVSECQKLRAKTCMEFITATYLTKYNHQPICTPQIGRKGVPKVLVVDQSYGDMSITRGLANDLTFQQMLNSAIAENPDADIIIKTHPDTLVNSCVRSGYYTEVEMGKNLYKLTTPINPISLLKYVDKIYACTTQLGFEALLCGKEVHVFGMPFYAGWGLTKDRLVCPRRTHRRTLEEVFYIAYIMYSRYVNPATKTRCEIEEAMNYLLTLRAEYFEEFNVLCELDKSADFDITTKRHVA